MAKDCKKIPIKSDLIIPGISTHANFHFREPSIVIDAEMYYKLKYSFKYKQFPTMYGKLCQYIDDLRNKQEEL